MQITLDIPDGLVARLRNAVGEDIGRAAIERFAEDGYRSGKLTRFDVQQLLGFNNRWDAERWLGARGVNMNYSLEDLEDDRATLTLVLGEQ